MNEQQDTIHSLQQRLAVCTSATQPMESSPAQQIIASAAQQQSTISSATQPAVEFSLAQQIIIASAAQPRSCSTTLISSPLPSSQSEHSVSLQSFSYRAGGEISTTEQRRGGQKGNQRVSKQDQGHVCGGPCGKLLHKSAFSTKQWRKPNGKCYSCLPVSSAAVPPALEQGKKSALALTRSTAEPRV